MNIITITRYCSVLTMLATLAACTTVAPPPPASGGYHYPPVPEQDGGPRSDVDVSKIPNAVPREEPLSKYGNPASYKVYNDTYYVLHEARNYDRRGMASWYGTKFHNRRTSSGEPYNMYGMTAASPDLPLPTYCQVINLQNGKSVIVKVNDRGPFDKKRIMDLSYVAAKKLDMMRTGTAYVEVKAIDPSTYGQQQGYGRTITTTYADKRGNYYLQIGAYTQETNAMRIKELTQAIVNKPVHIKSFTANGGQTFKVQIGPFADDSDMNRARQQLSAAGFGTGFSVAGD